MIPSEQVVQARNRELSATIQGIDQQSNSSELSKEIEKLREALRRLVWINQIHPQAAQEIIDLIGNKLNDFKATLKDVSKKNEIATILGFQSAEPTNTEQKNEVSDIYDQMKKFVDIWFKRNKITGRKFDKKVQNDLKNNNITKLEALLREYAHTKSGGARWINIDDNAPQVYASMPAFYVDKGDASSPLHTSLKKLNEIILTEPKNGYYKTNINGLIVEIKENEYSQNIGIVLHISSELLNQLFEHADDTQVED